MIEGVGTQLKPVRLDTGVGSVDFKDYAAPSPGVQNMTPNNPPTANLVCPVSGAVGQSLQFDGSGSSGPDGPLASYEFDWGDGTSKTTGAANKVNHTFTAGGSFSVTLIVKDGAGASDTDACTIAITVPETV